jgi:hypothetical protein
MIIRANIDRMQEGQRGSVIVWILIMVALFGALSYTFMRSNRVSGSTLTEEKNGLLATEIISYAGAIRDTVKQLRVNGCTETQISFEQSNVTGYTNGTTPSNHSCKVYHASGGAMAWEKISGEVIGSVMGFTGQEGVNSVGTAAPELILKFEGLSLSLCQRINMKAGMTGTNNNPPFSSTGTCDLATAGCKFTGTYTATYTITNGQSDFNGKTTGCYNKNGTGAYVFYQVLLSR